MMTREANRELPRSDTNPTRADSLLMVADLFDQGFDVIGASSAWSGSRSALQRILHRSRFFCDSPFLKPHLLHPSSIALDGRCLGLSIQLVRVGPHLFKQLLHIILLFAHVSFSLDCADDPCNQRSQHIR